MSSPVLANIQVSVRGPVGAKVRRYAEESIRAAIAGVPEPVQRAEVRLTEQANGGKVHPVVAQSRVDVNGRPIRTQVSADTGVEAVDALRQRLGRRLAALRTSGRVSCGDWRPVWGLDQHEPAHPTRPVGQRRIARRKPVTLQPCTVDEAAAELDLMDYDFYLFTERGSGQDSVLYRIWPGCFRLVQARPSPDRVQRGDIPLTVAAEPAPRLSLEQAVHSMDHSGNRFLFYIDTVRGRGCVLYRRYDGHYGLIGCA